MAILQSDHPPTERHFSTDPAVDRYPATVQLPFTVQPYAGETEIIMLTIVTCITQEHDWRLMALAAIICLFGSGTTFAIWTHLRHVAGGHRLFWLCLAATTAACTIWATHFAAMLAHVVTGGQGLDLGTTLLSFAVAIPFSGVASHLMTLPRRTTGGLLAAVLVLTAAIASMHYTGMLAYQAGSLMLYDPAFVVASLVLCLLANAGVVFADRFLVRLRYVFVPTLMAAAVTALHFTGMAATTTIIASAGTADAVSHAPAWLAMGIAVAVLVILVTAGASVIFDRMRLRRRADRADALAVHADGLREACDAAEAATRAKSQFLANMSHEIRTPLNGVLGMAEMLTLTPLCDDQRDCVATIQSSGRSLLRIIDEILDLAKIESDTSVLDEAPFDLRRELEEIVALMSHTAESKGLRLHLRVRPGTPSRWLGDAERIRQIVVNLVGNAIKFTLDGTVLVDAAARTDGNGLEILVQDSGIGIPPERLGRIFDTFDQGDAAISREFGGTGLGLTISRTLAQRMGGGITVESVAGRGTTFRVDLRLTGIDHAPSFVPGSGRFAVIAADPFERELLCEMVETLGARAVPSEGADHLGLAEDHGFSGAIVSDPAGTLAPIPDDLPVFAIVAPKDVSDAKTRPNLRRVVRPVRLDRLRDWITHPAGHAESRETPQVEPDLEEACHIAGQRLLIADDGPINRKLLRRMLTGRIYEIEEADDGQGAVDLVEAAAFDVILMDVSMPCMDGMQATEAIRTFERRNGREPALILGVTAHALPDQLELFRLSGMDGVLTKPVTRQAIFDMIDTHLGSPVADVA